MKMSAKMPRCIVFLSVVFLLLGSVALPSSGPLPLSMSVSAKTPLNAPTGFKGSVNGTTVNLEWNKAYYAEYYRVYYSTSPDGKYKLYLTTQSTKCEIKGIFEPNTTYYFKVTSLRTTYTDTTESEMSKRIALTTTADLTAPKNIKVKSSGNNSVIVSWDAVPGAAQYTYVYSYDCLSETSDGNFEFLQVEGALGADIVSNNYVEIKKLIPGWKYTFSVCVYDGNNEIYGNVAEYTFMTAGKKIKAPTAPVINKCTASNSDTEMVTLEWNKVKGAVAYAIYGAVVPSNLDKANGNDYELLGIVTDNKCYWYVEDELGTTYHFKVKAINADENGRYAESKFSKKVKITMPAKNVTCIYDKDGEHYESRK